MSEELAGGLRGGARREGDRVRRGPTPPYAVALLAHLAERGWAHAPRVLETGPDGSLLTCLAGTAAVTERERAAAAAPSALASVARLVRQLHDLTAGTWLAEGGEVACHHDLDPRNTIYRPDPGHGGPDPGHGHDGRLLAVGLVDWDLAGPGERVQDLAHLCWTFTALGTLTPGRGADVAAVRHGVECLLRAYRWSGDLGTVVETMLWWQDRCWRGIASGAAAGDDRLQALVTAGVVQQIRAQQDWTHRHLRAR